MYKCAQFNDYLQVKLSSKELNSSVMNAAENNGNDDVACADWVTLRRAGGDHKAVT